MLSFPGGRARCPQSPPPGLVTTASDDASPVPSVAAGEEEMIAIATNPPTYDEAVTPDSTPVAAAVNDTENAALLTTVSETSV